MRILAEVVLVIIIVGSSLLTLEAAGHELNRADWETIIAAIVRHTAHGKR